MNHILRTLTYHCLLGIILGTAVASPTIEAFQGSGSDAYPGGAENGWLSGWEIAGRVEPEEFRPEFSHTMEASVTTSPPLGKLSKHLAFAFSTADVPGREALQLNYGIGRRYDAMGLAGSSTQEIRFLLRLDNFEGFKGSEDFVGAFGVAGRGSVQANTSMDTTWFVRMRADTGTWWIGRGDGSGNAAQENTRLPFEMGATYEVVIRYHVDKNTYDVKIDGEFTLEEIPCIRANSADPAGPMWLQFHAQSNSVADFGKISFGGVEISGE